MMTRFTLSLLTLLLVVSCTEEKIVVFTEGDPRDAGSPPIDSALDEGTPDEGAPDAALDPVSNVDLLLVIDNSRSMEEEQASLADEIPVLDAYARVRSQLLNPDTGAARCGSSRRSGRLRVGVVITSDMGTGGFNVSSCSSTTLGDDGLLIDRGNVGLDARCEASYPVPQTLDTMGAPPNLMAAADFAVDVTCIAQLGTDGCGFEQQLDSMLKAVTPSSSALRFQDDTPGNGTLNGSFGGDDAVLAVVMMTDEDDCSTFEPDLFNPSSTRFNGDLNLRCFRFPEAVHPVSRFRDGLLEGRDAGRVVFLPIVGVPEALAPGAGEAADYTTILAAPEMQEVVDPVNDNLLTASCNVPGRGFAFPPRRIVQLAEELDGAGAHASVASICQTDYGPALNLLVDAVADAMAGR